MFRFFFSKGDGNLKDSVLNKEKVNHLSTNVSCYLDKDQKTEKTKLKRKILGNSKRWNEKENRKYRRINDERVKKVIEIKNMKKKMNKWR